MALPPGFLEDLLSRVPLSRVVGRKVSWDQKKSQPARADYWAPCPFHQEKSASFHVDDTKGVYYCFGCQAKGDAVTFLRETESLGFVEAVEMLAREAGVPMPARDAASAAKAVAVRGLGEAMEAAVQFYRLCLNGARATEARGYLDRRGLGAATRETFELGFAPDARTALLEHLTGKGFARERLVEAGLVGLREDGSAYDRFRGRLMFPIRDASGRAIAFGARALTPGQEPKYLNSPDTPLFDKGRTLYNHAPARSPARRAGTVIVAEGYMDVIALAQAGFEHAVAPLGTSVTAQQLELVWKLADEPVIAMDGDAAGQAAAHRVIELALPLIAAGRGLRFAVMPEGRDPDEVLRDGGAEAMAALLAASRPMIDLVWSRETEAQPLDSPERRAAFDARLRARIDRIADTSLRGHWQAEIRERRLTLFAPKPRPQRAATAPFGPGGSGRGRAGRGAKEAKPAAPMLPVAAHPTTLASLLARDPKPEARIRESAVLAGCLCHPGLVAAFEDRLERMDFACSDLGEIRDALLSAAAGSLHQRQDAESLREVIRLRLGFDPLGRLMSLGQVRSNPHLGPAATVEAATRAIDEALTRHAALIGRREELHEAVAGITGPADEAMTARLRHASDAEWDANTRSLAEDVNDERAEHLAFMSLLADVEAQQAAKKRRR